MLSCSSLFAMTKNKTDWLDTLLEKQKFSILMPKLYDIFDNKKKGAADIFDKVVIAADRGSIPMIYLVLRNESKKLSGNSVFCEEDWKKTLSLGFILLIRVEQDVQACQTLGQKKSFHWGNLNLLVNNWYYKRWCELTLVQNFKLKLLYWFKQSLVTTKITLPDILKDVHDWFTDEKMKVFPSPSLINACYPAIFTNSYKVMFASSEESQWEATQKKELKDYIFKERKKVAEKLVGKDGQWYKISTLQEFFSDVIKLDDLVQSQEDILRECEDHEVNMQNKIDKKNKLLNQKKIILEKKNSDENKESDDDVDFKDENTIDMIKKLTLNAEHLKKMNNKNNLF